jgi:GIY-YIG catalytic domain
VHVRDHLHVGEEAQLGESDAAAVVRALQRPAVPIPRVLEARSLLPAAPGFYCWWSQRDAIAGLPHVPHPLERGLSLLYVGISPARESSRQTIRSRVLGNHLNGNVGSSTLRFVLAALLVDALELHPSLRGTKVVLSAPDNARLSGWQRQHLLLTWCARERPWEIEGEVIAWLGPPLNSASNADHAFYPVVRAARAEFRRRARAASPTEGRTSR